VLPPPLQVTRQHAHLVHARVEGPAAPGRRRAVVRSCWDFKECHPLPYPTLPCPTAPPRPNTRVEGPPALGTVAVARVRLPHRHHAAGRRALGHAAGDAHACECHDISCAARELATGRRGEVPCSRRDGLRSWHGAYPRC
jgi:hypothetical protein